MENKRATKGIWIPIEIWEKKELTLQEKVFLVEIFSLDNEEGCFASNEYFANFFQLGKARCSQIITSLKDKGYITITYTYKSAKEVDKRIIKVNKMKYHGIEIKQTKEETKEVEKHKQEKKKEVKQVKEPKRKIKMNEPEVNPNVVEMVKLYQSNIGMANGMTVLYLEELAELIEQNRFTVELFKEALTIANDRNKNTLAYVKGIIKQWINTNITSLEQLKAYEMQEKRKKEGKNENGTNKNELAREDRKTETTSSDKFAKYNLGGGVLEGEELEEGLREALEFLQGEGML